MMMLQFPKVEFKTRQTAGKDEIFDPIRRKWIVLTPEEWVRQNLINYLMVECRVPQAFIAIERKIQVGDLSRRFDIVVYSRQMQPWLLAECKAMSVSLSANTISQMLGYVSALPAQYILISNGTNTYGWQIADGNTFALQALPVFV